MWKWQKCVKGEDAYCDAHIGGIMWNPKTKLVYCDQPCKKKQKEITGYEKMS